jgi:hypothetical protein
MKNKHKWYEYHIIAIRDYPITRLNIEIFCLVSYVISFIIGYAGHWKIFDFQKYFYFNLFLKIYFMIFIIVIFAYIDAIYKLSNNPKYFLIQDSI